MRFFFLSSHAHFALDPLATRVSGGAELQVALLARELANRGNEVVIAGSDSGQADGRIIDGVTTRTAGKFHTGGLVDTLLALPRVIYLLMVCRPDYVCVLGWTAWLYILSILRFLFCYKLVFICGLDTEIDGTFGLKHGWRGRLFERGVARSDLRFAMSEYQKRLFQRLGLSCGFYRNLILPRKNPIMEQKSMDLLWVARCQSIKRPQLFLDLVKDIPDARCEMICPKEDAELWTEISERAKALPNLTFHERVPYHLIQDHYDRTRFLVSTSEAEGFPNVMVQAAQGEAGVISLELDPDDLIQTFGCGFCAGGDYRKLVEGVRKLLDDPVASSRMGANAGTMIPAWLDNQKNAEAFLEGIR